MNLEYCYGDLYHVATSFCVLCTRQNEDLLSSGAGNSIQTLTPGTLDGNGYSKCNSEANPIVTHETTSMYSTSPQMLLWLSESESES